MENKRTLVVALGGNALLKRGEPLEADIQRKNNRTGGQNHRPAYAAMARGVSARQRPTGRTAGATK